MSHVCSCPVDSVHLASQCVNGHVHEKAGSAVSRTAPDNVRGVSIVPLSGFFYDPLALGDFGEVSADMVELLLFRMKGRSLP